LQTPAFLLLLASIMRDDAIVFEAPAAGPASRVWAVGALVRAVADALAARFNPVSVRGEISGFSRAASGHCYFSLKDEAGQVRCAMFRRAASLMDFQPKEGDLVELSGRLSVYEPRGDLQLIVETMARAGQGAWFEQFLKLKAKLEAEGLFDATRKRPIPLAPRGIGLVTSLGAAALQDVATALARRVPHIPVWLAPASVQGESAPAELIRALQKLYQTIEEGRGLEPESHHDAGSIDVILLVRGGGSLEDLWAFNHEALARVIAQSPVPVISGIGHETDFCIADFVADLRAPTPTAAAELCATERATWLGAADLMQSRLVQTLQSQLDGQAQRLDMAARRLGQPAEALAAQRLGLQRLGFQMDRHLLSFQERSSQILRGLEADLAHQTRACLRRAAERQQRAAQALEHLSPQRVLERGYALLQDEQGAVIKQAAQAQPGQAVRATLSDGELALTVQARP
jgi:exodeoxyribonuclease VII large subunit